MKAYNVDLNPTAFPFSMNMVRRSCGSALQSLQLTAIVFMMLLCCTCAVDSRPSLYSPAISPCGANRTGRQTFVRDPQDCTVFYTCFGNRYWRRTCRTAGTVYSLKFKVCVWKDSIYDDCDSSGDRRVGLNAMEEKTRMMEAKETEQRIKELMEIQRRTSKNNLKFKESEHTTNTRKYIKETNDENSREIEFERGQMGIKTDKESIIEKHDEDKTLKKDSKNRSIQDFSPTDTLWKRTSTPVPERRDMNDIPHWKRIPESKSQEKRMTPPSRTVQPPAPWWRSLQRTTAVPPRQHRVSQPPWHKKNPGSDYQHQYVIQKRPSKILPRPTTSPQMQQTRPPFFQQFTNRPQLEKDPKRNWQNARYQVTLRPLKNPYPPHARHLPRYKFTQRVEKPKPSRTPLQSKEEAKHRQPPLFLDSMWWLQQQTPKSKARFVTRRPPQSHRQPQGQQEPRFWKGRTSPYPRRWWYPVTPFPPHLERTTVGVRADSLPTSALFPSSSEKPQFQTATTTTELMRTNLTTTMAERRDFMYTSQPPPLFRMTTAPTVTTASTTPAVPPTTTTWTTNQMTTSSTTTADPATTTSTTTKKKSKERLKLSTLPHRVEMAEHCGIIATPLIIGGRRSRPGQWPWQVSLQVLVAAVGPWHRCGGVLIHSSWVLTAAHCVEGSFYGEARNWRAVFAEDDLEEESGREIYKKIVRIISHPGYIRTSNFPNDMALLQLDSPVDLSSGEIRVACLPDLMAPPASLAQTPPAHPHSCWISGLGETRGGEEQMMNELSVRTLENDVCAPLWQSVGIHVLDQQMCVGDGHLGACYGDSGGPLMCEQDGRFYVTGVMSWLINNCSAKGFPNVFTRVTSYQDWIYEQLDFHEWFRYN